jgi:1-aminocyclopropane-1-carboxylate deaminase/D-cysteine desulfhydrase-like pyridoxal-dependent ACC family enzyme
MHSILPTPFHRLESLSRELGLDLWCKRDDLSGVAFCGNKTRKLDCLIEEARGQGATDLVAVGGVQSNFCRIAASYAAHEGWPCHLVLGAADAHASRGGNLTLDELFGARVTLLASDDWNAWEHYTSSLAEALQAEGRRPYRLPIGGSTVTGAMGYVAAMHELLADADRIGLSINTIIHASSSGGTQAGLLAGKTMHSWPGRIIGIEVAKASEPLSASVLDLACGVAARIGAPQPAAGDVLLDARWIGRAYAEPSVEGREAQKLFARREGIVLDDVYTAKAAAGLIGMRRCGEITEGETVVFLHTGGSPQFFSYRGNR